MLKEKIKSKENGVKGIAFNINQAINPSYFYNLWKLSFDEEKYKKSKKYKNFIRIDKISTPKEMNNILVKLLPQYKINFFNEDPSKFSKKIKGIISNY